MLVPKQKVVTKWTPQNKEHYEQLGYKFDKFNHSFKVKAEDLPASSHLKIKVKCDICGKQYETCYRDYLKNHSNDIGDTCRNCCSIKNKRTCLDRYGVENPSQVEEFKEKRKQTHIKKYGVENAFQSKDCKEKSKQTLLSKYGVEYAGQIEELKEKRKQTCVDRYGFDNPNKSEAIKEKIRKTCLERYGKEYTLSVPEIREKGRKTLYQNGKFPSSKPEKEMSKLLITMYGKDKCFPGYPYDRLSLDCLLVLDDIKIDIEYDGQYWHKDKKTQDMKRDLYLISRGFKVIRVKANYEIPTKEQLYNAIDYLVKGNHSHAEIILDVKMNK